MGRKYRYKTRPYLHQVRAIRKLFANGDGGELFMEPRTGKSKTAIDYFSILQMRGEVDKVLIVCPTRVMGTWFAEIHKHSPAACHVVIWDAKERRKGPPPPVRGAYDLTILIVNYEAFATPGKKLKSGRRSRASGRFKTRAHLRKWLKSTDKKSVMILDESHRIASPSGSAANLIVTMQRDAQYKLLLTGTPVTKARKCHDLYMQYKWRDPKRFADVASTADEFKQQFGRWIHDNGFPQWVGPRNQRLLQERIHQTGIVVRREDCFDLPPKQDILRRIPLTSSADVYDQMAAEMVARIVRTNRLKAEYEQEIAKSLEDDDRDRVAELREQMKDEVHIVEASIKLVQGLRLRQITGGVATTDEGRLIRIGREKLIALEEELEAAVDHDEPVVIAAQFRADLAAVERMCRNKFKIPTWRLSGGIKRDEGDRAVKEFSVLDGVGAFIMQPQSGAEGIDLSNAAHMIWYSLTPSWVKYKQSCDRIALSRNSTTFTYLLGEKTVDEVLYDTLQTDGQVARAILDKPEQLLRDPSHMAAVETALELFSA